MIAARSCLPERRAGWKRVQRDPRFVLHFVLHSIRGAFLETSKLDLELPGRDRADCRRTGDAYPNEEEPVSCRSEWKEADRFGR